MPILKIVLLAILIILLLLLFVPFVFTVTYFNNPTLSVKWLFFRFVLFPQKPKKAKQKVKKTKKATKPKKEQPKLEMPKNLFDFLKKCTAILKQYMHAVGSSFKKIKVYDCHLQVAVAGEDAASAAINCGYYNSVVYPTFAFLGTVVTLNKPSIMVLPAAQKTETEAMFYTKISVRLSTVIFMGIKIIAPTFKVFKLIESLMPANKPKNNKQKDGANNERTV